MINSEYYTKNLNLLAFDLNAKYDFTRLYDISFKWFGQDKKVCDVYVTSGFGFTQRKQNRVSGCATFNFGFGATAILYQGWGINMEGVAKFGLTSPFFSTPANYIQYTIGAVHRFKLIQRVGRKNGLGRRYLIKSQL